jgi:hypothetical protein
MFGTSNAYADFTDSQICDGSACLNAWNGGPFIYVYTAYGAEPDDEFGIHTLSNGNVYIEFTGGGSWNKHCVGDAYNDPDYVTTSLDACPTNSNSGGWGTNFTESACGNEGGIAFKDIHGKGYLYPLSDSNGESFYLNGSSSTSHCFGVEDASEK